ncbi:DUF6339 family protein [Cellulomonas sp. 179-A 9B4 NHS]|uniref:DUF6339 family protein n=1 Tax=Cellulomonas sp. 179-A 9B4 NHS TaxID=3142379 RepID=UPI0039A1328D
MSDAGLRTFTAVPTVHDRERMLEDPSWSPSSLAVLRRRDGSEVSVAAVTALMDEWRRLSDSQAWGAPSDSDRWLAPRLHWALRITRAEAADKGVWLWLALRHLDYVAWRWGSPATEDRWTGGVNKQTFARLWWGAESFRDGGDYESVTAAFTLQDLPNSLLHREITRVRPFAVALARFAAAGDGEGPLSADRLNNIAGVANLVLGGLSPEAVTSWWVEDHAVLRTWCRSEPAAPASWDALPAGPGTGRLPSDVTAAAEHLVRQCDRLGPDFARAKGNRAGRRVGHAAAILEQMYG